MEVPDSAGPGGGDGGPGDSNDLPAGDIVRVAFFAPGVLQLGGVGATDRGGEIAVAVGDVAHRDRRGSGAVGHLDIGGDRISPCGCAAAITHILDEAKKGSYGSLLHRNASAAGICHGAGEIEHVGARTAAIMQRTHVSRQDGGRAQACALRPVHNLVENQGDGDLVPRPVHAAGHGGDADQVRLLVVLHQTVVGQAINVPDILTASIGPEINMCLLFGRKRRIHIAIDCDRSLSGPVLGLSGTLTPTGLRLGKG